MLISGRECLFDLSIQKWPFIVKRFKKGMAKCSKVFSVFAQLTFRFLKNYLSHDDPITDLSQVCSWLDHQARLWGAGHHCWNWTATCAGSVFLRDHFVVVFFNSVKCYLKPPSPLPLGLQITEGLCPMCAHIPTQYGRLADANNISSDISSTAVRCFALPLYSKPCQKFFNTHLEFSWPDNSKHTGFLLSSYVLSR